MRFKVRFAWQAQGFRDVAKYVAGAGVREGCRNVGRRGGFERVRHDAFRVASAGISRSAMSMFEASDAESVEKLQISSSRDVTLKGSFRVAVIQELVCLSSTFSKHPLQNRSNVLEF